jgi:hypothetical protein
MKELQAAPGGSEDLQPDLLEQQAAPAPVLITEQEVLLGTTAALPQPAKRTRWWAGALQRVFAASPSQPRPQPRQYPRRSPSYFQSSLVSREGYRL